MATLIQFSKNIRKRGSQIENSSTRLVKSMAKRCLRSLVLGTKVDKGVARSNWRVGIGSPTRKVIPAYHPYKKGSKGNGLGMNETANAFAAISAGSARINAIKGKRGVGLQKSIYITNHIPYPKAAFPTGLVESAILESRQEIKGFKVFKD